jgi:tRNA pseudouridine55 synthase
MATGLLIVCTGKKTKEIEQFMRLEKEYEVQMILGARTASFDSETPIIERHTTDDITEEMVRSVLQEFVGCHTQLPPMWSAAKVGGKRLYKYARKGLEVERRPREVFVDSITVSRVFLPEVHFTIVCSKGMYVRTLVDEAGKRLGCGAYVTALERTRLGDFHLADALSVEDLAQLAMKKSHQSV